MSEIIRIFFSVFSILLAGFGMLLNGPIRRFLTRRRVENYLIEYFLNSRIAHWLANSFFVSIVILFLIIAFEHAIGINLLFNSILAGLPSIITLVIMVGLVIAMILV